MRYYTGLKDIFGNSKQECANCGQKKMSKLEQHHCFPQKLGGTFQDGMLVLCKKCHTDIHRLLRNMEIKTKGEHLEVTKNWILKPIIKSKYKDCPRCDNPKCFSIQEVQNKSVIYGCCMCGHREENVVGVLSFFNTKLEEMKNEKNSNTING